MVSSQTVAALYVDPRGPYPKMSASIARDAAAFPHMPRAYGMPDAIDCWDAERDARLYVGPHPVVAHPPCGPWGRLRHLYRGNEHDCAPRAVEQVRAFGGVLEHPAGSLLWEVCGLPVPSRWYFVERGNPGRTDFAWVSGDDSFGGYTVEVDQVEWGHVARKRTWLYLVGVPREALEAPPFPGREPTRSVSGKRGRATQAKHPTWKEQLPRASDTQRRRTPPLFAEYLVRLARAAQK